MKSFALVAVLAGLAGSVAVEPTPSPTAVRAVTATMAISVTDGVTSATQGDELVYTISVRNDGADASGQLGIRFEAPTDARLTTVDQDGTRDHGVATWSIDLPAGGAIELTAGTEVGTPPAGVNGLAGIACVVRDATPLLCATDMNQLAGRPDVNATVETAASEPRRRAVSRLAGAIGLAVVAAFGVCGLFLVRLRRKRRRIREAGG
jgi:uncharacterized repeat protein (TIGR01451 family)